MGYILRRRRRQRTVKRGGAYVGQGTYGCGFSPALRCEGEAERRPGKFSKLMSARDAEDELRYRRLLQPLDPKRRYFIYPDGICRPAPPVETNQLNRCPHDFGNLSSSRILIQADGGKQITEIQLQAGDFIPFFRSLRGLIEGLEIIHAEGIAHNDIKPANIVSKRFPNGKFLTRYIDLGLMVDANTFEDERTDVDLFRTNYMYWAFDVRFVVPSILEVAAGRGASITRHIQKFYEVLPETSQSFPARALYSPKLNVANVGILADYYDDMPPLIRYAKIFSASDIHGLGISLAQIYYQFIGHRDRGFDHVQISILDVEAEPVWHVVDGPLVSYTAEETEWHRTVAREISLPFYTMIRRMITTDSLERATATTVLADYDRLLPAMERLFTADAIRANIKSFGTPYHVRVGTPVAVHVAPIETQETPRPFQQSPLVAESNIGTAAPIQQSSPGWITVGANGKPKKGGRRKTLKRARR
jgi:hypothetical protein